MIIILYAINLYGVYHDYIFGLLNEREKQKEVRLNCWKSIENYRIKGVGINIKSGIEEEKKTGYQE